MSVAFRRTSTALPSASLRANSQLTQRRTGTRQLAHEFQPWIPSAGAYFTSMVRGRGGRRRLGSCSMAASSRLRMARRVSRRAL